MKPRDLWVNALLLLFLLLPVLAQPATAALDRGDSPEPGMLTASEAASLTPRAGASMFVENVGQFADGARFYAPGSGFDLWIADDGLWITIWERPAAAQIPVARAGSVSPPEEEADRLGANVRLSFPNANPDLRLEPFGRLESQVSYFIGNDPRNWHPAVPVWSGVRYVGLYPGIDLELTTENGQMAFTLTVHSGADASAIQLQVEGATHVSLPYPGSLVIDTVAGAFTLPLLALDSDLQASPDLLMQNGVFFITAPFARPAPHQEHLPVTAGDRSFPLLSNPSGLLFSTRLGGDGSGEEGYSIAVDANGSAYVAGSTPASGFPTTPGAFDTTPNYGTDAFVARFVPDGSALVYATYLGGSSAEAALDIALDANGAAYITGYTYSADFPTTPGAFDTTYSDSTDVFVAKLSPNGSTLGYSSLLGDTRGDTGYAIAVDLYGAAFVTGWTGSAAFPTTPGAFDTIIEGNGDSFVLKMAPDGASLIYSAFLGGNRYDDIGRGIAVDAQGAAYVVGRTGSTTFPVTPGAFDTTLGGYYDFYVAKVAPDGATLGYVTFLGGSNNDGANVVGEEMGIVVDSDGAAYITGSTISTDFPTTPGAFDSTNTGGELAAVVVRMTPDGSGLAYATYLGGSAWELGRSIAVDENGVAAIVGSTGSADFPVTPDAFDSVIYGDYDVFVACLSADGGSLEYGTFLGGSASEDGYAIAYGPGGTLIATGTTYSPEFPVTPGAFDTTYGLQDVFVTALLRGVSHRIFLPLVLRTP